MRTQTTTYKVKTDFGAMYIHIDTDHRHRPVGRAFVKAKKYPNLEYTIEKVYFGNHNENKVWDYTGEQRRVLG